MKPKIVSFKFTKKQPETKGKPTKTKKNYENIFNDISMKLYISIKKQGLGAVRQSWT